MTIILLPFQGNFSGFTLIHRALPYAIAIAPSAQHYTNLYKSEIANNAARRGISVARKTSLMKNSVGVTSW
jgi:hypothetical protein